MRAPGRLRFSSKVPRGMINPMTKSVSTREIVLAPDFEIQLYEPSEDAIYTIEATAHLLDLPHRTILVYCKHRLLSPVVSALDRSFFFDRDGIRALRRIEALRTICGDDFAGIKLILDLTEALERLQTRMRSLAQENPGSKRETKPPREKKKKGERPTKAKLNKRRK
jgi:DNA-binding transcriptional MerR regulator